MRRLFCAAALAGLTACAAPTLDKAPFIDGAPILSVGFENAAYAAGDPYGKAAQSADWTVKGNPRLMAAETSITSQEAASGKRSLKVRYAAGEQAVKQAFWTLPPRQSYTLSYKVKFADGFTFNGAEDFGAGDGKDGGKLPGLAGFGLDGSICSGGMSCLDGGGFTARLMWRTDGEAVLYLYDLTKSRAGTKFGEDIAFGQRFIPGRWHEIRQTVTLNTPGKADGSIVMFMDNQAVISIAGRELVGSGEQVDHVLFSTFFGGNAPQWFPRTDQYAYFDDFEVRVD